MKIAYAALAVLSLGFAAFSAYYGGRLGADPPTIEAGDEEFRDFRQRQRSLVDHAHAGCGPFDGGRHALHYRDVVF